MPMISPPFYIAPDVKIGKNVIIKPFAVIGLDGFGFETDEKGLYKIPYKRREHKYTVIIEDNVEIGAGCVIDRGSWRDSIIGEGTKLDNMVHTGHNSQIGKNCLLVVGTVLGGSCTMGDNCFVGMNV